jgi:hypothetical protein
MATESALKVVSDTDETNDGYQREPDGKFAPGNKGGPGGSRPGSGRKPKPADESLVKRLYDLLDQNADRALEVLVNQLEHEDPKIAQKAAAIVLNKTLPEGRFLKEWRTEREKSDWRDLQEFGQFLMWKMDQDVTKAEVKEKQSSPVEGAENNTKGGDSECQ